MPGPHTGKSRTVYELLLSLDAHFRANEKSNAPDRHSGAIMIAGTFESSGSTTAAVFAPPVLKCHLGIAFQVEDAAGIVGSGYTEAQSLNNLAHLANLQRIRIG